MYKKAFQKALLSNRGKNHLETEREKMRLSKQDVKLFYKLYHPLLVYVNKKLNILEGLDSAEGIGKFPIVEINNLRKKLYENSELIEAFVTENPLKFSTDELKIISSWKKFVKERFIIYRYLKEYTVFLDIGDSPKAYGVLGLSTSFEELFGPHLPIMVDATLLPFRDKIIYDSIFSTFSIVFGGGLRRRFNDAYREAKHRFGIITSLPFSAETVKQSDADRLRFYLKSESNRERYWKEIEELLNKDPSLLILYHQEMGKIKARIHGKQLREIGFTRGWFAILENEVIASGTTREEVKKNVQNILPAEKRNFVYIFQLKSKR